MSGETKVYLQVSASAGDTFRRAGFVFTRKPIVVECSPEQAALIKAESGKTLAVKVVSEREFVDPRSDAEMLAEASAANESLGAKLDAARAEIAATRKANADAQARIAELEGLVAKANADLEALTAPAKPEAPAKTDEKTKPAKG